MRCGFATSLSSEATEDQYDGYGGTGESFIYLHIYYQQSELIYDATREDLSKAFSSRYVLHVCGLGLG